MTDGILDEAISSSLDTLEEAYGFLRSILGDDEEAVDLLNSLYDSHKEALALLYRQTLAVDELHKLVNAFSHHIMEKSSDADIFGFAIAESDRMTEVIEPEGLLVRKCCGGSSNGCGCCGPGFPGCTCTERSPQDGT